jgi:hypothetical protein
MMAALILALKILAAWFALSLIAAPVLIPKMARRTAKNKDWFNAPPGQHHLSSVTPQIRMLRPTQRLENNLTGAPADQAGHCPRLTTKSTAYPRIQ